MPTRVDGGIPPGKTKKPNGREAKNRSDEDEDEDEDDDAVVAVVALGKVRSSAREVPNAEEYLSTVERRLRLQL